MLKCPRCKGKGTEALHGVAITQDEWWGPDWNDDMRSAYLRGDYDTPCDLCGGRGSFHEQEDLDLARVELYERQMGM